MKESRWFVPVMTGLYLLAIGIDLAMIYLSSPR